MYGQDLQILTLPINTKLCTYNSKTFSIVNLCKYTLDRNKEYFTTLSISIEDKYFPSIDHL